MKQTLLRIIRFNRYKLTSGVERNEKILFSLKSLNIDSVDVCCVNIGNNGSPKNKRKISQT